MPLPHLAALEAEALTIFRECAREGARPVLLYSIGKDSSVLLHLARKAFHPGPIPFPLLHVDTGWKFREMYEFRARTAARLGVEIQVHMNEEGVRDGVGPFSHGSAYHTDVMKTAALKQALDRFGFDVVIGGARRDEEKSRAKERIFSLRRPGHRWDPKAQRPELWGLYNVRLAPGESLRVFPLSNWTEGDVWRYILAEGIDVVPLYFARERPVVRLGGQWILAEDERLPAGLVREVRKVRFRTLGCWPLTAAVESEAETLEAVVAEVLAATTSERQGRLIDHDAAGSMERKKHEGYF
ncbi:MAG: sulfate adenylyltransferase small subunit [Cyanobacteria bacterium RYN_339]|nr:sulfate adenylyltransferase small subunit [Cyanobacteria bacterium RYN_339]